jgi:hypothetical protein
MSSTSNAILTSTPHLNIENININNNEDDSDIPTIAFNLNIKTLLPGEVPEITEFKRLENSGRLLPEPLLLGDKSRFVLFPIKHPEVLSAHF